MAAKRSDSSGTPTRQVATVGGGDHEESSSAATGTGGNASNTTVPSSHPKTSGSFVEEPLSRWQCRQLVSEHVCPVGLQCRAQVRVRKLSSARHGNAFDLTFLRERSADRIWIQAQVVPTEEVDHVV